MNVVGPSGRSLSQPRAPGSSRWILVSLGLSAVLWFAALAGLLSLAKGVHDDIPAPLAANLPLLKTHPAVIFADEPTASLDHRNGHIVVDLLAEYKAQGTVIIVTHDAEMLAQADRVLVMRDGKAVEWVSTGEANRVRSLTS